MSTNSIFTSSLTTLKMMLNYPLNKSYEEMYTVARVGTNNGADKHQFVETCNCMCCKRINTLKILAGPMPFAEGTPVWILKYCSTTDWEQATFIGREIPDLCDYKVRYKVHTPTGYCGRDVDAIRFSPPENKPVT